MAQPAALSRIQRFSPPHDAGLADDASEWEVGDLIAGRYDVERKIVSGMGVVYLCHDRAADEPIAIKTYRDLSDLSSGVAGGGWQRREVVLARLFASEALIWMRLGRHPNIVEARYVVELGGKPHLFLERVAGADGREQTLRHLIRSGPLDPTHAIRLALQVCAGMEHAITVFPGLVHRDLKHRRIFCWPPTRS